MTTFIAGLSLVASADAATRFFSCEQITLVDPPMVEHLDLTIEGQGRPVFAEVTRVQSGALVYSGTPLSKPNYDGGYWYTNYALKSYKLGVYQNWTTYVLLVPDGLLGSTFDAQLHLLFDKGMAGWWPNEFECTEVP
jgi:hypothetical protein